MTKDQIKAIQEKVGASPDGNWGPKSKTAAIAYLKSLMPVPNPWPADNFDALNKFYGFYGEEYSPERKKFMKENIVNLGVEKYGLKYDGKPVRTIRCNVRVAESLTDIFAEIKESEFAYVLEKYGGCLEIRDSRTNDKPSRHSWGSAIDFMALTNLNHTKWPKDADMPFEVMEIFSRRGWLSAGVFWGRDSMHHQATKS